MSRLFQQVMHEINIQQFKCSAYHPESQGSLERFNQTLKEIEAFQASLGFSPFELVFGHSVGES